MHRSNFELMRAYGVFRALGMMTHQVHMMTEVTTGGGGPLFALSFESSIIDAKMVASARFPWKKQRKMIHFV